MLGEKGGEEKDADGWGCIESEGPGDSQVTVSKGHWIKGLDSGERSNLRYRI